MMLSEGYIESLIQVAERDAYFQKLHEIYREIPSTTCKCCGDCCRYGPRVYLTEYLHIFGAMKEMRPEEFRRIVKKSMRFGFLSLVDPSLGCPLLDEGKCILYENRSFNCRAWGHSSEEEYYLFIDKARKELESERDFWLNDFGIKIPESIVHGHKTFCSAMKITGSVSLQSDMRTSLERRLERLDHQFLRENMIDDEAGVLELPLFVCFTFLGSGKFFKSRPHVMKEYSENGNTEFLEKLIKGAL